MECFWLLKYRNLHFNEIPVLILFSYGKYTFVKVSRFSCTYFSLTCVTLPCSRAWRYHCRASKLNAGKCIWQPNWNASWSYHHDGCDGNRISGTMLLEPIFVCDQLNELAIETGILGAFILFSRCSKCTNQENWDNGEFSGY